MCEHNVRSRFVESTHVLECRLARLESAQVCYQFVRCSNIFCVLCCCSSFSYNRCAGQNTEYQAIFYEKVEIVTTNLCLRILLFRFQLGVVTPTDKLLITNMTGPLSANVKVWIFFYIFGRVDRNTSMKFRSNFAWALTSRALFSQITRQV